MKKVWAVIAVCLIALMAAGLSACKPQPGDGAASTSSSTTTLPMGEGDQWGPAEPSADSSVSAAHSKTTESQKPFKDSISVSVIAPGSSEVSKGNGTNNTSKTGNIAKENSSAISSHDPSSRSEWIEGDY